MIGEKIMKLIQIGTNYYKFSKEIKTIEEFVRIANKSSENLLKW